MEDRSGQKGSKTWGYGQEKTSEFWENIHIFQFFMFIFYLYFWLWLRPVHVTKLLCVLLGTNPQFRTEPVWLRLRVFIVYMKNLILLFVDFSFSLFHKTTMFGFVQFCGNRGKVALKKSLPSEKYQKKKKNYKCLKPNVALCLLPVRSELLWFWKCFYFLCTSGVRKPTADTLHLMICAIHLSFGFELVEWIKGKSGWFLGAVLKGATDHVF